MANLIHTTGSELAAVVPELWSQRFYDALREQLPFQASVSKDWEGEIQNLGDTVNISAFPEFDDASLLSEGASADADAITVSNIPLVINKMAQKDVIVTRQGMLQSLPFMDEMRDKCIFSILKKLEQEIIDASIPSAAAPDHQIGFDSGTTLGLADILEAKELLDEQNVPLADRYMVVDAPQYNDIFNLAGFTSREYVPAGSPLSAGEVTAPVAGFQVKLSTRLSNACYFFHKSYLTVAMQKGLNINLYDLGVQGARGTRLNVDLLFGVKLLDNKRVVKMS